MADEPGGVFCRNGGLDGNAAAVCRMVEGETPGVQHQPAGSGFLPLRVGVDGIADERVPQVQHVHADLVGAPGVQGTHDQ